MEASEPGVSSTYAANEPNLSSAYYWGRDLSGSLQGACGVGGLLAYTRNGALRIPVYDHIGNVVAVVDGSGATVAAYEYAPFGALLALSGPEADEVPFRFSTKYFDAETGLPCAGGLLVFRIFPQIGYPGEISKLKDFEIGNPLNGSLAGSPAGFPLDSDLPQAFSEPG